VTRPDRFHRLRRFAYFSIAMVCVLAGAESAWRLLVPKSESERQSADFLRQSLAYLEPCAGVERGGGQRILVGHLKRNTGGDFVVPLEKGEGVTRVAFVGESTGVMIAGPAADMAAQLGASETFQVLDCADSGSTLDHVARRADEVLGYAPDALVVVFGHNWMMPHYPMNETSLRLRAWLSRSRLVAGLADRFAHGPAGTWAAPSEVDHDDRAQRLARLEGVLRRLAASARERGVALVVTTLVPNLWFPPTANDDVELAPRFLDAVLAHVRDGNGAGERALESLVEERPEAYWHFRLGTWLARDGDRTGAERHLQAAVDLARLDVDRATTAVNGLIRRVAREEHLVLDDLDARFRKRSRDHLPGWDFLRDPCHLQPRYLREEAIRLVEMAAAAAGKAAPPDLRSVRWAEDDVLRYVLAGLVTIQGQLGGQRSRRYREAITYLVEQWGREDRDHTLAVVDAFLGDPAFTSRAPKDRGRVMACIAAGYRAVGLAEPARALARRGAAEGSADAFVQLGLFDVGDRDLAGAEEAFAHAVQIDPKRVDAARFLEGLTDAGHGAGQAGAAGRTEPARHGCTGAAS
jgi:hypothetical protein